MHRKRQSSLDFSERVIKGKIAETVFEQMFRRVHSYTVIPFGYESIIPELMQYTERKDQNDILESVRNAPDFALVSHDPKQVLLVEVKYRTKLDLPQIKQIAERICDQWKSAWIFIATPQGFFFDYCADVAELNTLTPLDENIIPAHVQEEYLKLIRMFITSHDEEKGKTAHPD